MQKLYTKQGRSLPEIPWNIHPRPQLQRDRWLCLNGRWELSRIKKKKTESLGVITVPFCPESLLSGVSQAPAVGDTLVYSRSFSVPEDWAGSRILLHFGAVMRDCRVCVNGKELTSHDNGYLPFSIDITDTLREGENSLSVETVNDLDFRYPWGKQSRKRGGMWYTPCSGIWQTVWLEPVPEVYIRGVKITNGDNWAEIRAEGVESGYAELEGKEYPLEDGFVRIELAQPHSWTPEDPHLYYFTLTSGSDSVRSYFALRTLTTESINGIPRLCLNGKPYFFNALLDQGYWSDGLYTPASPSLFGRDILAMKALGFNTLRKHIKIEPEQFYYDCDRLGMIVFQDMVNNGKYRYVRDTVLPTLHFQTRKDENLNPDPRAREIFLASMDETVRLLSNHPCICLWTIFNEGWGQFCSDEAYTRLRAIDSTRFIDSTSGWFHQSLSDVDSLHIYFDKLHLGEKRNLPQLLSEFGGYVWKEQEHSFNTEKTYGYKKFDSRSEFVLELYELFKSLVPLAKDGLCGAVYTQLSDVEDETNGIFTFDREIIKLQSEDLGSIARELQEAVSE